MQNFIQKTMIVLLAAVIMQGCERIIYDAPVVVGVRSQVNGKYKYVVEIQAVPHNQLLYTNRIYSVGDTLTNCQ